MVTTSCPARTSLGTRNVPMCPLPPMTTILMDTRLSPVATGAADRLLIDRRHGWRRRAPTGLRAARPPQTAAALRPAAGGERRAALLGGTARPADHAGGGPVGHRGAGPRPGAPHVRR